MIQQIIVYIIGLLVLIYIAYRLYRFIRAAANHNPCDDCKGCDLKSEIQKATRKNQKQPGCCNQMDM